MVTSDEVRAVNPVTAPACAHPPVDAFADDEQEYTELSIQLGPRNGDDRHVPATLARGGGNGACIAAVRVNFWDFTRTCTRILDAAAPRWRQWKSTCKAEGRFRADFYSTFTPFVSPH